MKREKRASAPDTGKSFGQAPYHRKVQGQLEMNGKDGARRPVGQDRCYPFEVLPVCLWSSWGVPNLEPTPLPAGKNASCQQQDSAERSPALSP
jgi:hypothetical protein